ncbi:MAG: T9SS type A sorting domain-containing protein, partial [Flavobacteriales bacterium]|nr:T9SS type A sorting domain-containing protein [Flavobacteriales bacterium]
MKQFILTIGIFLMGVVAMSQTPKGFEWIRSHGDNNSFKSEWVRDIQVDQAGNIYVAGEVNDQWVRDSNGVIIPSRLFPTRDSIANYGQRDIWLAKYDPQGNLLWHRYAGGGDNDVYFDMVADQNGNCYVAGKLVASQVRETHSFGKAPIGNLNRGTFIAKVNSSGSLVWHRSFGGDTINGTFMTPYSVGIYNLKLENNKLKAFIVGGGDQVFGYQTLYGRDSLENSIHEISYDLNGNYIEAKTFPFPRFDRLPQITNISSNNHGAFISGILNQDTTLVGNDTILKSGLNNAFVFAFDTALHHVNSFYSNNSFDQFHDAKIMGDTLVVAGDFDVFNNNTVNFDTVSYTANSNEGQVGGIFLFDTQTNRLIGLYPSSSLGFTPTVNATSAYMDNTSFGIGGIFDEKMTFTGSTNYIEAVDNCASCINSDLFFSLFDRAGNSIAEDVIYTSRRGNSGVFSMALKDTILYIGGFVGDSVIIAGVDTFVTRGSNDAFLAAYNIGLITTSIGEASGYIKANNGILAYPNPTQGQVTLMGKAVSKEAQLFNISGQQVRTFRLDQNAFRQTINLENLESGVYFLIIIGENEKQQVKI